MRTIPLSLLILWAAVIELVAAPLASERPNILWIVAEDISPFFGCYGSADAITPNIDGLAKRSHVFKRAYATAPICSPSRSCLATGMYATSLGSQHLRCEVRLPKIVSPLAKVFQDHGYWTALRGKTDYNFDAEGLFNDRKSGELPWANCPDGRPFFAFWNLGSTHEGSGNRPERAALALKRLPPGVARDPDKITVPPHHPNTPEMRRIWARYHELITVFDLDVKAALDQLEADGLAGDTIVFLMADHGLGLPRYKRWLYLTGLHVPLLVHLPERFRGEEAEASIREALVSYVDLPATALELAEIEVPATFAGHNIFTKERSHVFGARDRADDMVDLSRCVFDGRYLYIRHFLPHLPAIQEGYILSPVYKESLIELHRVHNAGLDSVHSKKLWERRPFEELYDIQSDPHELRNLADEETLAEIKQQLSDRLRAWILATRDSGFLTEPEMHRRALEAGVSQYEILIDNEHYPIEDIVTAAEAASRPDSDLLMGGADPILDFWAVQQRIIRGEANDEALGFLREKLASDNPTVRATSAEALARLGKTEWAIPVFRELLALEEPNLRLYVARSLAVSMTNAQALEAEIRATRQAMLAPPGSRRPWKDFVYSAFTSWALEWALVKSGLNEWDDFKGL